MFFWKIIIEGATIIADAILLYMEGLTMNISEKILCHVQALPEAKQAEVLDFIEFLNSKIIRQEEDDWSVFTISSAMRDMEQEPSPYSLNDLKEPFL